MVLISVGVLFFSHCPSYFMAPSPRRALCPEYACFHVFPPLFFFFSYRLKEMYLSRRLWRRKSVRSFPQGNSDPEEFI